MIRQNTQSGFTAIELLITLFIASAFLVSGYQLYNAIIKDSGQTRAEARASNVAYDYLRRYSVSAANPCIASTPLSNSLITIAGLGNPRVTVAITCPYAATTTVSKVEVTITHGTPTQTVKYATYVKR